MPKNDPQTAHIAKKALNDDAHIAKKALNDDKETQNHPCTDQHKVHLEGSPDTPVAQSKIFKNR